jgi:hypothetical protein
MVVALPEWAEWTTKKNAPVKPGHFFYVTM